MMAQRSNFKNVVSKIFEDVEANCWAAVAA